MNEGGYTKDGRVEICVTSAVGRQMSAEEVKLNRAIPGSKSDTKSGCRIVTVRESRISSSYRDFDTLENELGIERKPKSTGGGSSWMAAGIIAAALGVGFALYAQKLKRAR